MLATMDALEITYRLRRLGKTQIQLAGELGVSQSTVNNVIHNRITCYAVALHIADLMGCDVHALFPGRYEFKPRGRRLREPSADSDISPSSTREGRPEG